MKHYSKALSNQRRIAFGKANKAGKALLTGTHYLVLKNADKLDEPRTQKLQRLWDENANLNTLYILSWEYTNTWVKTVFSFAFFMNSGAVRAGFFFAAHSPGLVRRYFSSRSPNIPASLRKGRVPSCSGDSADLT